MILKSIVGKKVYNTYAHITVDIARGNGQVECIHRYVSTKLSLEHPTKWYRFITEFRGHSILLFNEALILHHLKN